MENNNITNPKHYTNQVIETIHILDDLDLPRNLDRALEYIMRANRKNQAEDLLKAMWYLTRHLITHEKISTLKIWEVVEQSMQKSNEYINLKGA